MKTQIVSIRRVANDRLQAEMLDVIERQRVNVLRALNQGDAAFDGKARHCWFPVTLVSLALLGVSEESLNKIKALKFNERFPLVIDEPTLDGKKLRIQINETTTPTQYQKDNWAKAAKQIPINDKVLRNPSLTKAEGIENHIGEKGYFVTEEGHLIFSNTIVTVEEQVNHTIVAGGVVPEKMLSKFRKTEGTATLAAPTPLNQVVQQPAM